MREIVGEPFPNEMMFLQGAKTVLEDGAFRSSPGNSARTAMST